jgi:hypothetical protein
MKPECMVATDCTPEYRTTEQIHFTLKSNTRMGDQTIDTTTDTKACGKMPESYDGTPAAYRGFKTQVKVYLWMNKKLYATDEEHCLFTCLLIRGNGWAQIYTENYMEAVIYKNVFPNNTKLWDKLDSVFIDWNECDRAANQLEHFQQKGLTAHEYFIQFIALATKAGINTSEPGHYDFLRRILNRNLNGLLVDNLYWRDSIPINFAGYRKMVESLDAIWRQRQEDTKGWYHHPESDERKKDTRKKPGQHSGREDVPMDVDWTKTQNVQKLTAEQEQDKWEGRCFKCHVKGHLGRNCPTGSMPARSTIYDVRAMTTEEREKLMEELKGFVKADNWAWNWRPQ